MNKPEGNRTLGRLRRRWMDNIKINLKNSVGMVEDWIDLAQCRDNWRALSNAVILGFCNILGIS